MSSRPEYSFRSMSRILSYSFFRMSGSSWPTIALWESWMAMRCSSDSASSVMMQERERERERNRPEPGGDGRLDPVVAGQHLILAIGGVQAGEGGRGELAVPLDVRYQALELLMPHEASVHFQQLQLTGIYLR